MSGILSMIQGTDSGFANLRASALVHLTYEQNLSNENRFNFDTSYVYNNRGNNLLITIKSTILKTAFDSTASSDHQKGISFILDLKSYPTALNDAFRRDAAKFIKFEGDSTNYRLYTQYQGVPVGGGSRVEVNPTLAPSVYIVEFDGANWRVMNEAIMSDTNYGFTYAPTYSAMTQYVQSQLSTRWSYHVCSAVANDIPAGATYWDGGTGSPITGTMAASGSTEFIIYLVLHNHENDPRANDIYDEWITVKTGTDPNFNYNWEKIGNTDVTIDYNLITDEVTPTDYTFTGTAHSHTMSKITHSHTIGDAGDHSHTVTVSSHSHSIDSSGAHSHTFTIGVDSDVLGVSSIDNTDVTIDGGEHTHSLATDNHSHTIEVNSHSHSIQVIGNHSHTVTVPSHSHSIETAGNHKHSFVINRDSVSFEYLRDGEGVSGGFVAYEISNSDGNETSSVEHTHTFSSTTHSHVVDGGKHSHNVQVTGEHSHTVDIGHTHEIKNSGAHKHTTAVFESFTFNVNEEILYLGHSHEVGGDGLHTHSASRIKNEIIATELAGNHSHTMSSVEHTHTVSRVSVTGSVTGGAHHHTYTKASITTHTLTLNLNNYEGFTSEDEGHVHTVNAITIGDIQTTGNGKHSHTMSVYDHSHTVGNTKVTGSAESSNHTHLVTIQTVQTKGITLTNTGDTFTIASSGEHVHTVNALEIGSLQTSVNGSHSHTMATNTHSHKIQEVAAGGTVGGGAHSHTVMQNT